MNEDLYRLAESRYRRGTVLGLTVAEIFILLLFLLMLIFLLLWREIEAQQQEQQEELDKLKGFVGRWEEPLSGIKDPREIATLIRIREEMQRSGKDAEGTLLDGLMEAIAAKDQAEAQNEQLQKQKSSLQKKLNESSQACAQASKELRVLKKGQNPPCWYKMVQDGAGSQRERALYAFNIGVFDEYMVIRRLEPPPGGAEDDGDSTYAEEWDDLQFADIRFDVPLSNAELREQLQRIHDAGKNSEVRSYSCIFSVRVWDETSANAKARWQQAHDRTLEWLFGTFTVDDEPWEQVD